MSRLIAGPFNRVEGDLEIRLEIDNGSVSAAYANSPLYRGFERMLTGKEPQDALTITPRICGICSISQSAAAAFALADAAGRKPTPEGAKIAALLHAVENACDHLTHFNLFFMPDFTRPVYEGRSWHTRAVDRFTAATGGAPRAAVEARAALLHIVGLLGGKWPHTLAIQPGGVTRAPTARDLARIGASLRAFRRYLEGVLFGAPLEEVAAMSAPHWDRGDAGLFAEIAEDCALADLGRGRGRYMSFGAYPLNDGPLLARGLWQGGALHPVPLDEITEDLSHAWMLGESAHPTQGVTLPDEHMPEPAYSWCKSPRLAGAPVEVGALARQVIDGQPLARALADEGSVRARVWGRLIELARSQILLEELLRSIRPEARFMDQVTPPRDGQGAGLVEAARGALGHWVRIADGRIANYQIIAPTTWNFGPRDSAGTPGPVEAALEGAPVLASELASGATPVAVQHIVRSFDPCMVCTVH